MKRTIELDEETFEELDGLMIKLRTAESMLQMVVEDGVTLKPWQRDLYFSDRVVINDGLNKLRGLIGEPA